jgi:AcrR family transcriptional regulator
MTTMVAARRGRPPKSEAEASHERARILKAAERLFAKNGYAGVSMRKVADAAGCSAAALYNLFPHKRALLRNIWEGAFDALDQQLSQVERKGRDPAERLKRLGYGYVEFWVDRPDHFRALFLIEDRVSEPGERYFVETSESLPRLVARFESAAQAVIAERRSKMAAREFVELVFCALHGATSVLIGMPEYAWPAPETLAGRMMETLLNGLEGSKK